MPCRWVKYFDGMWRCTHPEKNLASEFCTGRNAEARKDYCENYEEDEF